MYILNDKLKAWKYNDALSFRSSKLEYCFIVYSVVDTFFADNYKCVSKIKSPPFSIITSRTMYYQIDSQSKLQIEKPISKVYTSKSSIIISPILLKFFPFLNYKNEELLDKMNKALPCYLSKLPKSNIDDDNNIIVKYNPKIHQIKLYNNSNIYNDVIDFLNTLSEDSYRKYENFFLVVRSVNKINISANREEISYLGDSIPNFLNRYNNNLFYLDKYGNKCKFQQCEFIKIINDNSNSF